MQRNNYSEATKKISGNFFSPTRNFFFQVWGAAENWRPEPASFFFCSSDFVVDDPRGFSPIFSLIDLEVGEKRRALLLEQLEHRHRAAADLQLGAFTRTQLQHRPPGASVRRHDDFG